MKKIKNLLFGLFMVFAFVTSVDAATGSINASTSSKTVAVGSTFTVTVKVSCSEALGSWQFGVSYDSAYISLQSGDVSIAEYGNGSMKTKSYTYKFKAIKAGNATVRISSPSMVTWNDDSNLFTPSSSNATVTVKTQQEIQASYSKDNNLKSLTVEGYELSPVFNKDVTEYTVSVPDTVEQIKVSAQVNDSKAHVTGTGDISLSQGINKVEVVVTAQNGSVKKYYITVDVKDLNPIEVESGGVKYTVVKKLELLTEPIGHTPTTIKIGEVEVPAFKSELTHLTILGLKDESGKISMFIYDADANTYEPYREIKNSSLALLPIKTENDVEGFQRTKITINGEEYEAFQSLSDKDFYLIFGMNVGTGDEDYYIFDIETNMFVKYNSKVFENINTENKEFKIYTIALGGIAGVLFLLSILVVAKNSKYEKIIKRLSKQLEETKGRKERIEPPKEEEAIVEEEVREDEVDVDSTSLEEKKKRKKKR